MENARTILEAAVRAKGLRYVGTRGDKRSDVCVVGEAPGADEDQAGLPFVGASGREQDKMLREAGLHPDVDCWFTNPYKVRPPDNKIERLPELGIDQVLFENQFFEELQAFKPTIIIACGKTPTNLLCPFTKPKKKKASPSKKEGFGKWRGSLLSSPLLDWPHYVIPVYHPAFVLRNWSERQTSVLIYSKAQEEYSYYHTNGVMQPLPQRELLFDPSYQMVCDYLIECLRSTKPVSIDIELLFEKSRKGVAKKDVKKFVYVIGVALNATSGLAFNIFDFVGSQLVRILRLLNRLVSTQRQIGQNFTTFDAHWLRTLGLRPNIKLVDDTRIRHHTLYPELEHTLAFMTMQYTRQPYYKDEGKVWRVGVVNQSQLRRYCCLDVCCTYEVFDRQEEEFARVA